MLCEFVQLLYVWFGQTICCLMFILVFLISRQVFFYFFLADRDAALN